MPIDGTFSEFQEEALDAKLVTLRELRRIQGEKQAAEAAEQKREQEAAEERARLKAEKEALAKEREEDAAKRAEEDRKTREAQAEIDRQGAELSARIRAILKK